MGYLEAIIIPKKKFTGLKGSLKRILGTSAPSLKINSFHPIHSKLMANH
jgi:hypothetical protein